MNSFLKFQIRFLKPKYYLIPALKLIKWIFTSSKKTIFFILRILIYQNSLGIESNLPIIGETIPISLNMETLFTKQNSMWLILLRHP